MDIFFSVEQFVAFAQCVETRFKENESLFRLTDTPKYTMLVDLTPRVEIIFDISGNVHIYVGDEEKTRIECRQPNLLLFIKWVRFVLARRKMWNIAERMLRQPSAGEKLLHQLFPELTEKHLFKKR